MQHHVVMLLWTLSAMGVGTRCAKKYPCMAEVLVESEWRIRTTGDYSLNSFHERPSRVIIATEATGPQVPA